MNRGAFGKAFKSSAAALVVGLFLSTGASAQSSSGAIIGEAKVGDTVVIYGTDNGFKRELKIEEDGKFQVRRVPTGYYDVSIKHADGTEEPSKSVVVKPGGAARVQ